MFAPRTLPLNPSKPLTGMTALVTGGAKRLGRATVLALARQGAGVAIHYHRSGEAAEVLAEEVQDHGVGAWTVNADLGDRGAVEGLFGAAVAKAGPVDILVNNASIFPGDTFGDATYEALEENFRVNAWAPFALMRAFTGQDRGGAIVNLLDARMGDYDKRHFSYHLSKRALFTFTRAGALELAPSIRVNGVAPGLVLPPPGEDESFLTKWAHSNPLNTHGGPEDIAEAVVFLAAAPFVTGQIIYVDGGRHLLGGVYG